MTARSAWLLLSCILAGCERDAGGVASDTAPRAPQARAAAAVVDSARSPEEALRRFRTGLNPVNGLQHGVPSRDALVRQFIGAVERSDTSTLRDLMMSRAEFAYLYYPSSPQSRPPTRSPPDVVWFLHIQNAQKGLSRVLARYGGKPLAVISYTCAPPRREAANTVWDDCVIRRAGRSTDAPLRLFGGIIEHAGRFKVFSYANDM